MYALLIDRARKHRKISLVFHRKMYCPLNEVTNSKLYFTSQLFKTAATHRLTVCRDSDTRFKITVKIKGPMNLFSLKSSANRPCPRMRKIFVVKTEKCIKLCVTPVCACARLGEEVMWRRQNHACVDKIPGTTKLPSLRHMFFYTRDPCPI